MYGKILSQESVGKLIGEGERTEPQPTSPRGGIKSLGWQQMGPIRLEADGNPSIFSCTNGHLTLTRATGTQGRGSGS